MPKTTQLTLSLVSRPGTLAALARTLAEAGVNITALSAAETSGRGKIRLLVNDAVRPFARPSTGPAKSRRSRYASGTSRAHSLGSRPGWRRSGSTSDRSTPPRPAVAPPWSS
jgi:hypothetical protein